MTDAKLFDRSRMRYLPLDTRRNKVDIIMSVVTEKDFAGPISGNLSDRIGRIADEIVSARQRGSAVMCAFGAHAIKNGMGQLLGRLVQEGWVTHLATNGAGVIHDWEFAFQGESSEDVRENVALGRFGAWEETGLCINVALAVGAYRGLGYGESVGALIAQNGIEVPTRGELSERVTAPLETGTSQPSIWERGAAADLLGLIDYLSIPSGFLQVEHPYASYSAQALAYASGVPFTSHPMFGHDIIYTHRSNLGAAVGRTAERDFLSFVNGVENLEGGVYLSVGSAVMSPMVFEKSLSMVRNVLLPQGRDVRDCGIHVVDLQEQTWDWNEGEPTADNPAYYLRFMKTFSRMGCRVDYTATDNRIFLTHLYRQLKGRMPSSFTDRPEERSNE